LNTLLAALFLQTGPTIFLASIPIIIGHILKSVLNIISDNMKYTNSSA